MKSYTIIPLLTDRVIADGVVRVDIKAEILRPTVLLIE